MAEESEEKTLPASDKKLKDGRKKGKVSQSKDLVGAGALLAVIAYLFIAYPLVRDRIVQVANTVSQVSETAGSADFFSAISNAINLSGSVLIMFIAPLVIVLAAAIVIVGIIGTMGPVFSFELVKLNFDHISPAKGFERIFSVRNVVEFAKNIAKMLILIVTFWLVVRVWVQSFFEIPGCGISCAVPVLFAALKPLAATAVIAFLIIGFIDFLIQRRLFLRDMRMSKTEYKREQKDLEGDPLIRSQRRRIRVTSSSAPAVGLYRATFAIWGEGKIVAVKYDGKNVQVPLIVAMAEGEKFADAYADARALGIPITEEPELVTSVFERHAVGRQLHSDFFTPIVRVMRQLRVI